jgi:hypothetical protein
MLDPDYGRLAMVYSTNKFLGYYENGTEIVEKNRTSFPLRICNATLGDPEFDS